MEVLDTIELVALAAVVVGTPAAEVVVGMLAAAEVRIVARVLLAGIAALPAEVDHLHFQLSMPAMR